MRALDDTRFIRASLIVLAPVARGQASIFGGNRLLLIADPSTCPTAKNISAESVRHDPFGALTSRVAGQRCPTHLRISQGGPSDAEKRAIFSTPSGSHISDSAPGGVNCASARRPKACPPSNSISTSPGKRGQETLDEIWNSHAFPDTTLSPVESVMRR
jgi:hypothetical protein